MSSSQCLHLNVFISISSSQCLQLEHIWQETDSMSWLCKMGSFRKRAQHNCRALSAKEPSITGLISGKQTHRSHLAGIFPQNSHAMLQGSFRKNVKHNCRALFAKEPHIAGLICGKCPARSRQRVCVASFDNINALLQGSFRKRATHCWAHLQEMPCKIKTASLRRHCW